MATVSVIDLHLCRVCLGHVSRLLGAEVIVDVEEAAVLRYQLGYRNPPVVAYMESVRRRYQQRMSSAASLPGGQP